MKSFSGKLFLHRTRILIKLTSVALKAIKPCFIILNVNLKHIAFQTKHYTVKIFICFIPFVYYLFVVFSVYFEKKKKKKKKENKKKINKPMVEIKNNNF
jgi:hypothetical protein